MASFLDCCRFIPASNGIGSFVVASAVGGYQTPASANAVNGAIYRYRAESADLTQWEVGYGVYTAATATLTRSTVLFNSSGGTSAINFTAVPQVAIVALAEDLANLGSSGGFVNKFRNGAMDVWQRGVAAITVPTAGAYTADGWIVTPTGASCTAQQAANNRSGANTLFGLQLTGAAGVTDIQCAQRIESSFAAGLAGNTVTVQAQIFNNTGASITPTLASKYPASTDVWTSPTTDLAATNLQACANGVWTQVAYTLLVSANATKGYELIFDFGNNFSTTGKDVVVAECDVRVTPSLFATGVNNNPPAPEIRSIAAETQFCQRYYRITPGTVNSEPTVYGTVVSSGQAFGISLVYPVPMRSTPTATITGTFAVSNLSAPTVQAVTPYSYSIIATSTSSAPALAVIQPSGSAQIAFSAEL
jgi:hypothetical protein